MRDPQDIDVLARRRDNRLGGLVWALPMAVVVAVVDQVTKQWAIGRLLAGSCDVPNACIELALGAKLHLVFNTGAAFSRGQGFGSVLGVLVAIITIILLTVARRRGDRLGSLLFGAIAGGAVGNLIDRAIRAEDGFLSGAVIDFIDFGWWPVFNVADAAVVCGVIGFVALTWFQGSDEPPEPDLDSGDQGDAADNAHPDDTTGGSDTADSGDTGYAVDTKEAVDPHNTESLIPAHHRQPEAQSSSPSPSRPGS